jgi:hemerythrin-like domain-containing protein
MEVGHFGSLFTYAGDLCMTGQSKPNVVASLLCIHSAVTRGLEVALTSVKPLCEASSDASTREGFLNYVRALSSTIHGHHLTEDELAFPYFRNKLREAPFDLLTMQHQQMVPILNEIDTAIAMCEEGNMSEGFRHLDQELQRMIDLWLPHIQIEEEHFTFARIESLRIPDEEHARLMNQIVAHSQKHTGPPHLVLPFLLYNLQPDKRALMAAGFPPEISQHLIPVAWKDQWATMKPFLLEP